MSMNSCANSEKEGTRDSELVRTESVRDGFPRRPNVDILVSDDEFALMADMPGCDADSIDVEYNGRNLIVRGQCSPRQDDNAEVLLRESEVGSFQREFRLNEEVDAEHITAEYENGVLLVRLPKAEEARPKRIQVKSS